MTTVTINLSDELNKKFREIVKLQIGEGKGTLGRAVEEALTSWIKQKNQVEIADEMINMMENGFDMGRVKIKKREELHER